MLNEGSDISPDIVREVEVAWERVDEGASCTCQMGVVREAVLIPGPTGFRQVPPNLVHYPNFEARFGLKSADVYPNPKRVPGRVFGVMVSLCPALPPRRDLLRRSSAERIYVITYSRVSSL